MTQMIEQCYLTVVMVGLYMNHFDGHTSHSSNHEIRMVQELRVKIIYRKNINRSKVKIEFFSLETDLKYFSRGVVKYQIRANENFKNVNSFNFNEGFY